MDNPEKFTHTEKLDILLLRGKQIADDVEDQEEQEALRRGLEALAALRLRLEKPI